MTWLLRPLWEPRLLDGLLAFQITGSPAAALVALAAPTLRDLQSPKDHFHA